VNQVDRRRASPTAISVHLALSVAAMITLAQHTAIAASDETRRAHLAQYYPAPPPGYYEPRQPCAVVSPGPFQGAARGAAGGAIFGGIAGNAGRGAAIGAGLGLVAGAARHATARNSGACY
jgi:hypothetical protein